MTIFRLILVSAIAVFLCRRVFPEWSSAALSLAVVVNSCYIIFGVWIYPFYFSPLRSLPEPKGFKAAFPWYHADLILKKHNGQPYREWIHATPNDGLIRFRVLLNEERLLLTSVQALREVLTTKAYDFVKLEKPTRLFREFLGHGLLSAEGEEHQIQRKAMMPAFAFRHIKELYPIFWSKGRECLQAISAAQKYKDKRLLPQKAYIWSSRVTLDIIGLAGAGHDFHALQEPDSGLLVTYRGLFEEEGPIFLWTLIGLDLPVQHILKLPTKQFKTLRRASATIADFARNLIREKQQNLKSEGENDKDILGIALASGAFTETGLVDQMMTFLAAGHETTASSMAWGTYLLCKYPAVQQRLREEVRANLPSPADANATIDAQQIDKLPYLNAVCNEVLRFMSPVPMTARIAGRDTSINGQFVPKGTVVFIAAWATNVDHTLWGADAMDFKPERWLEAGQAHTGGAPSNFANLTFIHGAHSCIGKDFAKAEFAVLLATWVGRFEMSFPNGVVPEPDIVSYVTAKPESELPIVFQEVEGW